MPAFDERSHQISLEDARACTRRFRASSQKAPAQGDHASTFKGADIMELMLQQGCWGLRIYKGHDPKGASCLVLVGVDEKGRDLTGGVLLEMGYPCPPFCDDESPLGA